MNLDSNLGILADSPEVHAKDKQRPYKLERKTTVRICKDGIKRGGFAKKTKREVLADFLQRVKPVKKPDGRICLIWQGASTPIGNDPQKRYGVLVVDGKTIKAHRYAYMLYHGLHELPKNKEILHLCNEGLCVGRNCLVLDTHAANMAQAKRDGLMATGGKSGSRLHPESRPRGEKHPHAKITEAEVVEIRRLYYEVHMPEGEIAKQFNLKSVSALITGKSWSQLSMPGEYTGAERRRVHRANNGKAHRRITPEKMKFILESHSSGKNARMISELVGISDTTIRRLLAGVANGTGLGAEMAKAVQRLPSTKSDN